MTKTEYAVWLKNSNSMTAGYLRDNGVSYEDAKSAGMLPKQQVQRHRDTLSFLESIGHGNTPEARHLRHVVG